MTDFLNETIPGCRNFKWGEALYLPTWNVHVLPNKAVLEIIKNFAPKVQCVRNLLGLPMLVTSWYRPDRYNRIIGGADQSWHVTGGALDFRCPSVSADELRVKLKPYLEEYELRMENLPGSNWVHIDDKDPGDTGNRFFRP